MKKILVILLFCILKTGASHSEIPVKIFDGFLCLPNKYYVFNKDSNEFGVTYSAKGLDPNELVTGKTEFLNDPPVSAIVPWVITDTINENNLTIDIYEVNKAETSIIYKNVKFILIKNDDEYISIFQNGSDEWRDILNTFSENVDSVCK